MDAQVESGLVLLVHPGVIGRWSRLSIANPSGENGYGATLNSMGLFSEDVNGARYVMRELLHFPNSEQ
jgi:hypothetical protein